jgi:hypothetical protein
MLDYQQELAEPVLVLELEVQEQDKTLQAQFVFHKKKWKQSTD